MTSAAETSRVAELRAAREGGARVLVVNGDRDPFGIPAAQDADRVVVVPGEAHALKGHRAVIVAAVAEWLPLEIPASDSTRRYLKTKKEKLGHKLSSV